MLQHQHATETCPALMVDLRPIRLDDGPKLQAFMHALSDESRYFRFMDAIRELPPNLLRYFVEIDFEVDMALLAVIRPANEDDTVVGVARYYGDDDGAGCEFAIAVADAWHHHGLGHRLMEALMGCARQQGYRRIHGEVMAENTQMLELMRHLGFTVRSCAEDRALKCVARELDAGGHPRAASATKP